MKNRMTTMVLAIVFSAFTYAQSPLPKVYDESVNPLEQIDQALAKARAQQKHVIVQLGGNWCSWCLLLADYITRDSVVSKAIADNYVYIHVNYHPRKSKAAEQLQMTRALLKRLGNPVRFGFPVLVVLDEEGHVLHTQDSGMLEEGKGYHQGRVLQFLRNWTHEAVKKAKDEL